jgi:hypothetical protein
VDGYGNEGTLNDNFCTDNHYMCKRSEDAMCGQKTSQRSRGQTFASKKATQNDGKHEIMPVYKKKKKRKNFKKMIARIPCISKIKMESCKKMQNI